jgi:hypothetical protein
MLRTAQLPLEESAANSPRGTRADAGNELQILRAEVANSGATISKLQTQLKQSDAEMEQLGSQTARMAEELRLMQEKAAALGAVAMKGADVPPMAVSIVLPEGDSVDVSVQISLSGAAAAPPLVN